MCTIDPTQDETGRTTAVRAVLHKAACLLSAVRLTMLASVAAAAIMVAAPSACAQEAAATVLPPVVTEPDTDAPGPADDAAVRQQATRGGARTGVSPGAGYRTGPRTPSPDVARTPPRTTAPGAGAGIGRAGSFFGGLAAGALLGHLFNPFAGFGAGTGLGGMLMSLVSLLIWAVVLYGAYRLIKRLFGGGRGRGGWSR